MVYRILSIASHILTSLTGVALVICIVYTVASPAVQRSINGIGEAVDGLITDATTALNETGVSGVSDAIESGGSIFGEFVDGLLGRNQPSGQSGTSKGASSAGSGTVASTRADLVVADFADPSQGQAYLGWRNAIGDPMHRVFAGTAVTEDMLIGIAGGSSAASQAFLSLDEASLDAIVTNANSYSSTLTSTVVPANLPSSVQRELSEANAAARRFTEQAKSLVTSAHSTKDGSILAYGELANAANAVWRSDQQVADCMIEAERLLGVG